MGQAEICACGACAVCVRSASLAIASYASKQRRKRRWGRDAYVKSQTRLLLIMTGLLEEEDDELRRSDWGSAMQARQKITLSE